MKTPDLKPCPFCGNKYPVMADWDAIYGARVLCTRCGAYGPYHDHMQTAMELWNERDYE